MDKMKFLIMGITTGTASILVSILSSCVPTQYEDVQGSEIKHSSSEVISLYEGENEKIQKEQSNDGFIDFLTDGLLGSDLDDNDFYDHGDDRDHSIKRKRRFISKNGETLKSKLEAKKQ